MTGDAGDVGAANRISIDYPSDHDAICGFASFRILEAFGRHADTEVVEDTRKRVSLAMKQFPELNTETISIAAREPWDTKLGRADMRNRIVYLPTEHRSSFVTVYHELAHVTIQILDERGEDVAPSSERYTGLFGMARMPAAHVDEHRIPYFETVDPTDDGARDMHLAVPQERLPEVAGHALEYRQAHHDYHQQALRWLEGQDPLPETDPEYPELIA